MAVFGAVTNRSFGGRGPSFGFRFFCYAVLSVVLMFYDQKGGWLDTARYGLQAAIYPLQLAVNSPSAAWRWLEESFTTRETLSAEVDQLREELRNQQLITLRQTALEKENATLRNLNTMLPNVIEKRLVGEVINLEVSTLRQRLLVNRGGTDGVFKAQPVVTGDGVLGQVFRIGRSARRSSSSLTRNMHCLYRSCDPANAPSRSAPAAAPARTSHVPQNYDGRSAICWSPPASAAYSRTGCPSRGLRKWSAIPRSHWRRSTPCRSPASKATGKCCSSGNAPITPPLPHRLKRWRSKCQPPR